MTSPTRMVAENAPPHAQDHRSMLPDRTRRGFRPAPYRAARSRPLVNGVMVRATVPSLAESLGPFASSYLDNGQTIIQLCGPSTCRSVGRRTVPANLLPSGEKASVGADRIPLVSPTRQIHVFPDALFVSRMNAPDWCLLSEPQSATEKQRSSSSRQKERLSRLIRPTANDRISQN